MGAVLSLAAAGCSGGQSDLQKWIEATKKKPGGRIQPLPEVKPYESFVYSANAMRSPFQPQGASSANGQNLRPSTRRNREFLEGFSLDTLKMVGTFKVGSNFYGLVQSRAERRQSYGNYRRKDQLGRNHTGWSRRLYRATGLVGVIRLRPQGE
jgi:type IV pilus assembly protein PilP